MNLVFAKVPHPPTISNSHSLRQSLRHTRLNPRRPSQPIKPIRPAKSTKPQRSTARNILPPLRSSFSGERRCDTFVLPSLPRPRSPVFHKFELTATPRRQPQSTHIKRRFLNIARIVREVPQADFNTALAVNAPCAENLLSRNWEKKSAELSQVIPVYENTFEEDDWTDRDESNTPLVLKFLEERNCTKRLGEIV
jgi:hypothetical protein